MNPFQEAAKRSREKSIKKSKSLKQKNIELRKEYEEDKTFYGDLQEKLKDKERQYEELLQQKDEKKKRSCCERLKSFWNTFLQFFQTRIC